MTQNSVPIIWLQLPRDLFLTVTILPWYDTNPSIASTCSSASVPRAKVIALLCIRAFANLLLLLQQLLLVLSSLHLKFSSRHNVMFTCGMIRGHSITSLVSRTLTSAYQKLHKLGIGRFHTQATVDGCNGFLNLILLKRCQSVGVGEAKLVTATWFVDEQYTYEHSFSSLYYFSSIERYYRSFPKTPNADSAHSQTTVANQ